jgi:hypothetical protein
MAGRIAYYGNTVTNGLVLSLDAAKRDSYPGSGTAWRDISGNGNNGTLTNGPTFNSDNGGSIVFDGTNDRVDSTVNNIVPNSWTVGSWLINTKTTGISVFIAKSGGAPNYDQNFILGWASTFNSRFYISGKTTTGIYYSECTSSFSPSTSSIYNLVGTFDSNTTILSLYINGVLDNTKTIGVGFTTGSNLPVQLGCSDGTAAPGNFVKGSIYNTLVYNRALPATEVLQNYNAQKSRYGL